MRKYALDLFDWLERYTDIMESNHSNLKLERKYLLENLCIDL